MVILFILVVSVAWYSNNGTFSYGVSQNRSTLSYGGESALDSGVTAKMTAPSMGTTVASPEIAPSPLPPTVAVPPSRTALWSTPKSSAPAA